MKQLSARRFVHRPLTLLFLVGASAASILHAPLVARADEGADWKALHEVEAQLGEVGPTNREAAIAALQQFGQGELGPVVGSVAAARVSNWLRASGKHEESIAACSAALAKYPGDAANVIVLESLAQTLLATNKTSEAAALADKHRAQFVLAGNSNSDFLPLMASLALRYSIVARLSTPQAAGVAPYLQALLVEAPVYLDDRRQGTGSEGGKESFFDGWMFEAILTSLQKGGSEQKAQMAGWARAYFMLCAFNAKSLERATRALAKAWAANDNFPAVRLFAKAQEAPREGAADAASPNPFFQINAPVLDAASAKSLQDRFNDVTGRPGWDRNRALMSINLLLLQAALAAKPATGAVAERSPGEKAALGSAMEVARRMVSDGPEDAEGPQQVCRVFKAAEGNTRNANLFIAFLNANEQAANPLPNFLAGQ